MNVEELLKPRRKVINGWFQSNINPFCVGDILIKNGIHFTRIGNPKSIHENEVDKYPHLIRPMEWWEERKESELPKYVKSVFGKVVKVQRNCADVFYYFDSAQFNNEGIGKYIHYLPATEEQYIEYKELLNTEPAAPVSDTTKA